MSEKKKRLSPSEIMAFIDAALLKNAQVMAGILNPRPEEPVQ